MHTINFDKEKKILIVHMWRVIFYIQLMELSVIKLKLLLLKVFKKKHGVYLFTTSFSLFKRKTN